MTYYVNYALTLSSAPDAEPARFQAGPYHDFDEAMWNSRDIRSYAGVINVYIVDSRDETRQLVGGAGAESL
jgi:hypothetical protein